MFLLLQILILRVLGPCFQKCETQVIPVGKRMLWGDSTAFISQLGFLVFGTLLLKLPELMDISELHRFFLYFPPNNNKEVFPDSA